MKIVTKKTLLNFIEKLEEGKEITQSDLSNNLEVSIGFMNALIKKFVKKGYVKASQVPYKRFIYYLTPSGFKEKSKLVSEYFSSSLKLFRTLRMEYNNFFKDDNSNNYILFGLSEITEICIISALDNNKDILTIVDFNNSTNKEKLLGVTITNKIPRLHNKFKIIVTKFDKSQSIYNDLIKKFDQTSIVVIPSLCVSKKKPNFYPRKKND